MSTGLERGLQLLEYVAREQRPVSFSQINDQLGGISHASLSRLLKQLCELGFLNKDVNSNLYSAGHRMAVFSSVKTAGRAEYLTMCYSSLMEEISRKYEISVILQERVKDRLICIGKVQCEMSMRMQDKGFVNENIEEPWLQLLAAYDEGLRIRSFSHFQPEFFQFVRKQGYIYDNQQRRPNVRRLGFPLFDSNDEMIGCLGVGGNILELPEEAVRDIIGMVVAK